MKKLITALVLTLTICVGAAALTACNTADGDNTNPLETNTYTIGYSMAAAVSTLNPAAELSTDNVSADAAADSSDNGGALSEKLKEQLDRIGSFVDRTAVTVKQSVSDKEEYEFMLTVTTPDMRGGQNEFRIFYNAAFDADEDENGNGFNIESGKAFGIEGVISAFGKEYPFEGGFDESTALEDGKHLFAFTLTDPLTGTNLSFREKREFADGEYVKIYEYAISSELLPAAEYRFSLSFDRSLGKETLVFRTETFSEHLDTEIRYAREINPEGISYFKIIVKQGLLEIDVNAYCSFENGGYEYSFEFADKTDWDAIGDLIAGLFPDENTHSAARG